ncbi:hypothetical protein FHX74_002757 [Friedmanniella endophytica]|uniref:Protein ImuA n=1 Tax=Microlunatus kandeliicorticis TaxID=1759536 RepID=A0A7W3ITU3_9ACTN|nr:hypothetical protein [Microlunatus kandeliicorticis]MBA8795129.1 hypothetical protein [Microlunatus kandeliicorticis]
MSVPAVSPAVPAPARRPSRRLGAETDATIRELQERVHRMQGTAVTHPLETLPVLRPLVQLQTGCSYAVDSPLLAMALMAGPSGAGAWCGVVGVPEFGVEAAASLGVQIDRTVLVPEPGENWLTVAAAMVDVLTVVVVRPPQGRDGRIGPHQAARLDSRLRQREAALIVLGDWPRSDARLRVLRTSWTGIGQGYGHLDARRVTVASRRVGAPGAEADLWLPDADGVVRVAAETRAPVLRVAR